MGSGPKSHVREIGMVFEYHQNFTYTQFSVVGCEIDECIKFMNIMTFVRRPDPGPLGGEFAERSKLMNTIPFSYTLNSRSSGGKFRSLENSCIPSNSYVHSNLGHREENCRVRKKTEYHVNLMYIQFCLLVRQICRGPTNYEYQQIFTNTQFWTLKFPLTSVRD